MKQAALNLARAGVAVFPVAEDKAPLTPHGFHDATTDRRIIRAWSWPSGIGAAIPEGQFVLDVDPRNGGDDTLALFPSLPPTRTTKTQNGGRHYWLYTHNGIALRGKLGPGVDVKRAGKGYVLVPPSPGYVWIRGGKIEFAPDWLVEELVLEERETAECNGKRKFFAFEEGTAYGLAARAGVLEELRNAANCERNNVLNRAAFQLGQLEAGGELARSASKLLMETALDIGLSAFEATRTIESGWTAGVEVPRSAPS